MKKIAIAAVAALLVLGLLFWAPWGSKTKHITAHFTDASGLFAGNDVGVLGVPVGHVTKVTPDGDGVTVELEVPDNVDIAGNSRALIVARSVATDRYVELDPFISDAKSEGHLGDGGTIPLAYKVGELNTVGQTCAQGAACPRTASPVDFDAVLKSLSDLSAGLSSTPEAKQAVKRLVDSADAALSGKGPVLNQTINSLGGSTKILADQRQNITNLITSLDEVVKVINKNRGTANTFITQVSQASQLLASQKENFHAALVALNTVVAQLAQFDHDNRDLITSNLKDATTLMQTVLSRQNQVAEILTTFPVALTNVRNAVVGSQLRVRLEPTTLFPEGPLVKSVCESFGTQLCDLIDGGILAGGL